jgi:CRP-like cAMP-binding protein
VRPPRSYTSGQIRRGALSKIFLDERIPRRWFGTRLVTRPLAADDLASPLRGNAILAALPAPDLAQLAEHVRVVALARGTVTTPAGQPVRHVDFPLDAMISVMATFANGTTSEVAFIGREGFAESDAAFAFGTAGRTMICQIPGTVARMRADVFAEKLVALPAFDRLIRRSLRARMYVTEQIAACNRRHTVTERFARWLLTTSDQMGSDQIALTQETFAVMLGVRRAGVSEAASELRRRGAITGGRAAITISDRNALRAAGCECYDAIRTALSTALT